MIARITALVQAPLATVRAAQRVADDAAAVTEAVLGLARSVPTQLAAVTLRLGQIQTDITELPAISRGIGGLQGELAAVTQRLVAIEADADPLAAQLAAVQQSLDALAAQVDSAVALLPDPDESTGLIAKARDALTADAS